MMYDQYTNRIKSIVEQSRKRKELNKGFSYLSGTPLSAKELITEQRAFSSKMQLNAPQPLSTILNPEALVGKSLGHPDFTALKGTDETENHYIVSAFIDIAGSTGLFRSYELDEIYTITNTVQSAAIHTCVAIGGHVQRLQGDGVFAYFGGKNIPKYKAVEMAVVACSMITYFVANDLKKLFLGDEIENIKTRIGIDFGDDKDVLWANFGVMELSELTTLSLHTSLASKMQHYAKLNGIVVGDFVKKILNADEDFFSIVTNSKGDTTRYIYQDNEKNFRYTQYAFDWYKYLKSLPYIGIDDDGRLFLEDPSQLEKLRIEKLRSAAALVNSGKAFTIATGNISAANTGIKNQPHRFHYE
jgi:class 3 adenylate cyclase